MFEKLPQYDIESFHRRFDMKSVATTSSFSNHPVLRSEVGKAVFGNQFLQGRVFGKLGW